MKNFLLVFQAGKFVIVGIVNTLIDFGVLNLLMYLTNITSGIGYAAFKGISFLVAVTNSYFMNKFWTFKSTGQERKGKEFLQFFAVSCVGFAINVGVASLVVNVISKSFPGLGFSAKFWANIGALAATFCAMAWNFVGYKFIVFKKTNG
jgi:putative flippase GtrA